MAHSGRAQRTCAALRQWLLCQLLTQARLCASRPLALGTQCLLSATVIFTRYWQRRGDGVSSTYPVRHRYSNYPQLPT